MTELVLVPATAGVPFSLWLDDTSLARSVRLRGPSDSLLEFELADALAIPPELLAADGTRLLNFEEMRAAALDQAAKLEQHWHALVARLSRMQLVLQKSASGELVVRGVAPFPRGAIAAECTIRCNLNAVLVERADLRADVGLCVKCQATASDGQNSAQVSTELMLQIFVEGKVPQLSFSMPQLAFRLPRLEFPSFEWKTIAAGVTWPEVRLPALPFLPVTLESDPATFTSQVSAQGVFDFTLNVPAIRVKVHDSQATCGGLTLRQTQGVLAVNYIANATPIQWKAQAATRLRVPLEALAVQWGEGSLHLLLDNASGMPVLSGWLDARVTASSVRRPASTLTVHAVLPFRGADLVDEVGDGATPPVVVRKKIEIVQPSDVALEALAELMPDRLVMNLSFRTVPTDVLAALAELLEAVMESLLDALSGLAAIVQRAVAAIARAIADLARDASVVVVLDRQSGRLEQLVFGVHGASGKPDAHWDRWGFSFSVPSDADLSLLVDVAGSRRDAFLVVTTQRGQHVATLATDLWLGTPTIERPTGSVNDNTGKAEHLISLEIDRKDTSTDRLSIVPFGVRAGRGTFLQALAKPLPPLKPGARIEFDGYELVDLASTIDAMPSVNEAAKNRMLPFLTSPRSGGSGSMDLFDKFNQYVKITSVGKVESQGDVYSMDVGVQINALGNQINSALKLKVEPHTMTARIEGGLIELTTSPTFKLFGMTAKFLEDKKNVQERQMVLDLAGSDPRLYLRAGVSLSLELESLGKDTFGRHLQLSAERFVMHGGGFDLEASLTQPFTLRLNGLGTDFTFAAARLSVRDGRVSNLSLTATGKLPPALIGDVDVRLHLNFGMRQDNRFGLIDGGLELANKGKPIRSEQTHFVFTLDAVGLRVFEDAGEIHFCAFVSGSALFKPEVSELANGMLQKLAGVELSFTDCPICGVSSVIERELCKLNLSFVVALDEPARATLFDMFTFEVRSIGFEPRSSMFNGDAALIIGGQVSFADHGDVIRAECDFHRIYIAPPASGQFLPRIKCEGLGLALRLGSAFEIEGKVVAVDGRMPPNVLETHAPEESLKANGFMGQGRVAIPGLPPFAASFGFVEVRAPSGELLRAWFVFLEAQRISYQFQLGPVALYLREVGVGLGYHFTYVGVKEIDKANSVIDILPSLQAIASKATSPAKLDGWSIDKAPGVTLVASATLSMSSASAPTEPLKYYPEEEKDLPNLLLLNAVMAMRNTTFIMTANAWLGWNYYDWDVKRRLGPNELVGKQTMTGYIVLVGSRSEFLARLKSNPGGEVGPRLAMPDAFRDALKEVEFDAVMYIRPGLMHFELGWPNRIRWTKNIGGANLTVAGGAIFRVHDSSLLAGLNLEGQLTFSMSGVLDAGVVGIAVSASVYAAIATRIIGYLDALERDRSLYYSLFSLQVRVDFSVSAWLEIRAWMCKFTIRVSFSLSLQIDVLAELAIRGDGSVGSRIRATIAVSIFGRSLGLSVGLGFNPGIVDSAQAQVARFLNLGLVQEVPTVVPPMVEQNAAASQAATVGEERRAAAQVAASALNHPDKLAKVPNEEGLREEFATPPTSLKVEIRATDFQLIATYPSALPAELGGKDASEWAYVTFLPQDAKENTHSSFYAAPRRQSAPDLDHVVELADLAPNDGDVYKYEFVVAADGLVTKTWKSLKRAEAACVGTRVHWDAKLPYEASTEHDPIGGTPEAVSGDVRSATLTDLLFAAFRTSDKDPTDAEYWEPALRPLPLRGTTENFAERRLDPATAHAEQQLHYAKAIAQDPADRRCYEARDFLLHKFISDLFDYATNATRDIHSAHVLDLGLTFLVRRKTLDSLGASTIRVYKRIDVDTAGNAKWAPSQPCKLFNPPGKTFVRTTPTFDVPQHQVSEGKIHLDWELNWACDDWTEDFLQHYELQRFVTFDDGLRLVSEPMKVKRADGERIMDSGEKRDDGSPIIYRQIVPGEWQFTDEFEDLSEAERHKLLNACGSALVRYSIRPVCVSNTKGPVCSHFVIPFGDFPRLEAPSQAQVAITLNPAAIDKNSIGISLSFKAKSALRVNTQYHYWRIVLRPEAIVPAGQYGVDAETERSLGGWLGSSPLLLPDDVQVRFQAQGTAAGEIVLDFDTEGSRKPLDKRDMEALAKLRKTLAETAPPRAWRIFVQQVLLANDADDALELAVSSRATAELQVRVRYLDGTNHVLLKPAAFEFVRLPTDAEKPVLEFVQDNCLAPVTSGRAVQMQPGGGKALLAPHPDFKAATRLTWNITPVGLSDTEVLPWRLLAGFEIYRLDLDSAANKSGLLPVPCRVASARLLAPEKVALLPGEIGEVANWKATYPSQAARRQANGVWYSPAESYIEWPPLSPRVEVLPEPSTELIVRLLQQGIPTRIELTMRHNGKDDKTWNFDLPAQAVPVPVSPEEPASARWVMQHGRSLVFLGADAQKKDAAAALRQTLRDLQARPAVSEPVPGIGLDAAALRNRSLRLRCVFEVKSDARDFVEEVPLHYERDLHPLLEAIIARMRRFVDQGEGERVLDADRRPAPVVRAETVEQFLVETAEAQDPFGWLVMDRLGLGVTLRLFDAFNDRFLTFQVLRQQFEAAVRDIGAQGLYPETLPFLSIDYLLQPGHLLGIVDARLRPDADGLYGGIGESPWHEEACLSMVRISVRPRIHKVFSYQVARLGTFAPQADVTDWQKLSLLLAGDTMPVTIADGAGFREVLKAAGDMRWAFVRAHAPLPALGEDDAPGRLRTMTASDGFGEAPDAFGRFPPSEDLGIEHNKQIAVFHRLLERAFKLDPDRAKERDKLIKAVWPAYNKRFFEHSGIPHQKADKGTTTVVTVAYAATQATDPVMVAADADGRASITLPEADGCGHHFAYTVTPTWRYGQLLATAGYELQRNEEDERKKPTPHVIGTVERTAPVLPQALVSLGRLGDTIWWTNAEGKFASALAKPDDAWWRAGSEGGKRMALMLQHHPERRLARANAPAKRMLSHAGELSTTLAALVEPDWCESWLGRVPHEPTVCPTAAVHADLADKKVLNQVAALASPLLPFERTRVRLLGFLPHWYRHIVTVAASSGVEVSPATSVYLPDAASMLVVFDEGATRPRLSIGHPWAGRTVHDAGAGAFEAECVQVEGHARLRITLPLLRYRDTTDEVTARHWDGPIAQLPDHGVAYQVDLEALPRVGEPRRSITPVGRLVRATQASKAGFEAFRIAKDWLLGCTCGHDPASGEPVIGVELSPLGKRLRLPLGLALNAPGFEHDTDGALRVAGGWTLGWVLQLLHLLDSGALPTQRLAWAMHLWTQLDVEGIAHADDDAGLLKHVHAIRRVTIAAKRPTDAIEREKLQKVLETWESDSAQTGDATVCKLIASALMEVIDNNANTQLEVPWVVDMPVPDASVVSIESATPPRYLLAELMTPDVYKLLAAVDPGRAQALWDRQKSEAFGGRRLVITAQRGDSVPLPLRPIVIH